MSYASRGEKVFGCTEPKFADCSPPTLKRSDHRLKRFYSTFDRRAWDFCDIVRYQYFYDLVSGSQTCLKVDPCHQYVPLEDLIRILMAEKDAIINELEERLRQCCGDQTQKNEAENEQILALTQELNNSRNMLRQAMHKLQNIDEIINENKKLHCRLRCSEERIKYLEERKKNLERELADLRSKSQIRVDLERAQEMLSRVSEGDGVGKSGEVATERDRLQERVKKLEKELEESRKKENEIEMLKKQSKSDTISIEEMSKENECYRKKLTSMKCLEKQIQDLKKQGLALADKYKRESQKAAEQMKKMCNATKELQALRKERDDLVKRVEELSSHESQYKALQCKLKRVDAVIAENEVLNNKLLALDKLEKENEYLRCRLDQIQEMEMNAIEDKERISQLQCAVADQEEEMKDLLCQIERLTSGRAEEELKRLKCELYETNSKLRLCEEQLAEIPMLEAEIDELRKKLQCCCREFAEEKTSEHRFQKIEVRLPSKSTGISAKYKNESQKTSSVLGIRKEEKIDFEDKQGSCQEILLKQEKISKSFSSADSCREREGMSCEEVQNLLQSSKGIISCVLEDMVEHHREMEELELCNKAMKNEIESLKAKVEHSEANELVCEVERLKEIVKDKESEICELKKTCGKLSQSKDEDVEIETLKDLNQEMKAELEAACDGLKEVEKLEKLLLMERQARCKAEKMLKEKQKDISTSGGGVSEEDPEFDCCKSLQKEIDDLKLQIAELNKLTNELKKENELLRELQQPCPDFSKELDEKCALENLLSLLQAELDTFKGQRLSDECEALRNELKRVLEQNCQLKALVDCYRQRLDLEKKSVTLNQEQRSIVDATISEAPKSTKPKESTSGEVGKTEGPTKKSLELVQPKERTDKIDSIVDKKPIDKGEIDLKKNESEKGKIVEKAKEEEEVKVPKIKDEPKDVVKPAAAAAPPSDPKEASSPTPLVEQTPVRPSSTMKTVQDTPPQDTNKDLISELDRLKKLLAEKEKALADQQRHCDDLLNARDQDLKALQGNLDRLSKENENLNNSLKEIKAKPLQGEPSKDKELLDQLEQLKKEKNAMAQQLASSIASPPTTAQKQDDCQKLLKQLEQENADKIKKLLEQHEKELSNKDKAHNDNLNAMKAGYETDIRKLAERHRASIMRLQGLHEDEVKELNTNHETQMETMQKQSEMAINDVARGSAAKIRKIAQQHEKEMKSAEAKFGEKETKYQDKIKKLQTSLTNSVGELEGLKKEAKKDVEGRISQLKAKHSRELQQMKRSSIKRMSMMSAKYEGLISEEKKKSEAQLESLKKNFKERVEQERGDGVCNCKFTKKKPKKFRDPTCPLDFDEVIRKILEEGLDSLSFNEIALVHRKACCALKEIVLKSNVTSMLEPPVGEGCPQTPLLEADKEQLLQKIFLLENEIVLKQTQTQQEILNMEVAIKKERCRLQELKSLLQNEQQKNSKLKLLLTSQTKLQEDLRLERDKLGKQASLHQSLCDETTKQLNQEKEDRKLLEGKLEGLKATVHRLCAALDAERQKSKRIQQNDPDFVKTLRIRLEQSMNQEHRLIMQLDNEARYRRELECKIQALRRSFQQMVNLPTVEKEMSVSENPLEAKKIKEKQNFDQIKERKNKGKVTSARKHKKKLN